MFRNLVSIAALLALGGVSAPAIADRSNSWEFSIGALGNSSESSSGKNGSSIDVDSQLGFAFGGGYNLNPNLLLSFSGSFVEPRYKATYNTDQEGLVTLKQKASIFTGHLNGTWHFMDGPFTPFASAGFGWTHADSNVSKGPPVTGCWWDPWWGYICRNFYSTYKDTLFSYGLGAGLRYDFPTDWFVRGSINRTWFKSNSDGVEPKFDAMRLEVGWMFGSY